MTRAAGHLWLHILGALLLLAGVLALFEWTDLDIAVQDHFYNSLGGTWLIDRKNPVWRMLFYTGPKILIIAFGVLCLVQAIRTAKRHPQLSRSCLKITIALALIPLAISGIKKVSNIYTPHQVTRYGGHYPHVKVFASYPPGFTADKPGRGWPAGHASGGFALMILYYAAARRSRRIAGLLVGLLAGWIMGLYQTFNGQHFISHTLVTMLIAWILINLIEWVSLRLAPPLPDQNRVL